MERIIKKITQQSSIYNNLKKTVNVYTLPFVINLNY